MLKWIVGAGIVMLLFSTVKVSAGELTEQEQRSRAYQLAHCAGLAEMMPRSAKPQLSSPQLSATAGIALAEFYPDAHAVKVQLKHDAHNLLYLNTVDTPLEGPKLATKLWRQQCQELYQNIELIPFAEAGALENQQSVDIAARF